MQPPEPKPFPLWKQSRADRAAFALADLVANYAKLTIRLILHPSVAVFILAGLVAAASLAFS